MTATYLINRSPTEALKDKTPAELWFGARPNLSKIRTFGCQAYLLIPKQLNPGKLDPRSKDGIMLGYAPNGYRLWLPEEKKVVLGRDIIFDELKFPSYKPRSISCNWETNLSSPDEEDTRKVVNEEEIETQEQEETLTDTTDISDSETTVIDVGRLERNMTSTPRRSTRERKRPTHLDDYTALALNADAFVDDVPNEFKSIEGRDDSHEWLQAVSEEIKAIEQNKTWKFVKLPPGKRAISSRWVFRLKKDGDGNPERYKARLVVKGCSQKLGIDYTEVYAPVARLTTVRTLMSVINEENLYAKQLDVKNAFLHGTLEEEIYLKTPDGINGRKNLVCKLNKALYGLKQAPRVWNARFDNFVKQIGFQQSPHDSCLYTQVENKSKIFILLYVDDIILAGNNIEKLHEVKSELKMEFSMTDLGELKCFLGIKIDRNKETMFLSQSSYVCKLLRRFGTSDCKGVKTPLEVKVNEESNSTLDEIGEIKPYKELIGCLMYLTLTTRPDISAAVNFYSRFQSCATEKEWKGLKRVLRYLKETLNYGLVYKRQGLPPLVVYADSDWAGSSDRKSTTGYLLEVYGNAVSRTTRKQTTVALSSTEAEYVALACAAADLFWLRNVLKDLVVPIEEPITMYEDNQSCIFLLNKWEHKRLKHIDVKYHFVRDLAMKGTIEVKYIPSEEQKADLLTKGLTKTAFERLRVLIGMSSLNL